MWVCEEVFELPDVSSVEMRIEIPASGRAVKANEAASAPCGHAQLKAERGV